jgi:hypothetical protein
MVVREFIRAMGNQRRPLDRTDLYERQTQVWIRFFCCGYQMTFRLSFYASYAVGAQVLLDEACRQWVELVRPGNVGAHVSFFSAMQIMTYGPHTTSYAAE